MSSQSLMYLTDQVLRELRGNLEDNLERYKSGDFGDLARMNGWGVALASVQVDLELLGQLVRGDPTPEIEIQNSLIVHKALSGMTRAIAREERVWARLTHVECLTYARSRWLQGKRAGKEDVERHFFAGTLTQTRDDNAISRLWWNAEISGIACPQDVARGMRAVLRTADTRSNFIERSTIGSRPALAQAIVRILETNAWLTSDADNFREFMKTLNRNGGGILFETMNSVEVDRLVSTYCEEARQRVES